MVRVLSIAAVEIAFANGPSRRSLGISQSSPSPLATSSLKMRAFAALVREARMAVRLGPTLAATASTAMAIKTTKTTDYRLNLEILLLPPCPTHR